MREPDHDSRRSVPPRALLLSIGALITPATVAFFLPDALGEYEALLWLLALVPAFLLAYYRGWRGAALALAAGMTVLVCTHVTLVSFGRELPTEPALVFLVAAYIGVSLGVGWLVERLRRDQAQIEQMALTDALTGLPNRRHAMSVLDREFAAAQRNRPLVIAVFDIDRFKEYNDRYGHAAGDEALRAVGDTLRSMTRRMNLSARLGGEEFLSILSETDTAGALVFVDRIRDAVRNRKLPAGSITVSCGVAAYREGMASPEALLEAADQALYEAKRAGRDCVRIYGVAPEPLART